MLLLLPGMANALVLLLLVSTSCLLLLVVTNCPKLLLLLLMAGKVGLMYAELAAAGRANAPAVGRAAAAAAGLLRAGRAGRVLLRLPWLLVAGAGRTPCCLLAFSRSHMASWNWRSSCISNWGLQEGNMQRGFGQA